MSLGGPKTTTTSNNQQQFNQQQQQAGSSQQQQQGLNLSQSSLTPTMPGYLANYYQSMPGQFNKLTGQLGQMAQSPLYGQAQQANYQQGLNQQLGAANQNLQSSLARSGALNSNRAADMQTQLALGGAQQMGNYMAQTPLLNAQYQQSVLGQLGNSLANFANWKPPVIGQQQSGLNASTQAGSGSSQSAGTSSGQSSSQGTQTQQQSGGLLQSLLGGIMNAGLGLATGGLSNMLGLGGQSSTPVSTAPTQTASPAYYGMPWEQGGAGMAPSFEPWQMGNQGGYGGGQGYGFGLPQQLP